MGRMERVGVGVRVVMGVMLVAKVVVVVVVPHVVSVSQAHFCFVSSTPPPKKNSLLHTQK